MASDREKDDIAVEIEESSRRRKHRRSSDDEAEGSSKRRKHRHHRHHHRRHHRSRKHDDEDTNSKHGDAKVEERDVAVKNLVPDYDDVEEGEIMEEGEIVENGGGDVEVRTKGDSDNRDTEIHGALEAVDRNSTLPTVSDYVQVTGRCSIALVNDHMHEDFVTRDTLEQKESSNNDTEMYKNGQRICEKRQDFVKRNQQGEGNSAPKLGGKQKSYYDSDSESKERSNFYGSGISGNRRKDLENSPSHETLDEEFPIANKPGSSDRVKTRSRSQSIPSGPPLLETHQKGKSESDYRRNRDSRRVKERERSSSRSRYAGRGRNSSLETRERGREGSRDTWDRDMDVREIGRIRNREKEQESDRARGRERERERERDRDRDRERERERERERDRYRERERDRYREAERNRDHEKRDLDSRRERRQEQDGSRDKESDRRRKRYDDDGYSDRGGNVDYRQQRYNNLDNRDRKKSDGPERVQSSKNGRSDMDDEELKRDEVEQEAYQERITLQLAEQEEEELEKFKEESRRRRQAIIEKHKAEQLQKNEEPLLENANKANAGEFSPTVAATIDVPVTLDGAGESADNHLGDISFSLAKSPPPNGTLVTQKTSGTGGLGEGSPKSERSHDMFGDMFEETPALDHKVRERSNDMFGDMFEETPTRDQKVKRGGTAMERSDLNDNCDDADGYYRHVGGEKIDRYVIIDALGKGVFSSVVRAMDPNPKGGDPKEVAIKIIRSNDTMYKAGVEELKILNKLVGADPEDRRHCVRYLSNFKHRNHLCLVFESLHMNLREVLKKFGRNIGLKLTAVRAYAKQLFIALKHLRNCGVLHCDIKPDNMLVNDAKNVLKLCDFGNAMYAGKNEITPYLVSRFYRAPEIILGLPYDHPMDMWSVGCCLYELYSGKVLFPGATNNDMLRLHMELKGPFPKKMLRKGAFTGQHFDQDLNFFATEEDPVTKKTIRRLVTNIKTKDIGSIVLSSPGEDPKLLANFKDLLEKIFVLDPDKRLTVQQALSHPFITGK